MAHYAPVLRYLVETPEGLYSHPSRSWLTTGQTAWADPGLQFMCYSDAAEHARSVDRVVKLRISAKREPIKSGNRPNLNHVPESGREAFHQGWQPSACPHPPSTVAAMLWVSDWWRANAEAFADHIGEPFPDRESS